MFTSRALAQSRIAVPWFLARGLRGPGWLRAWAMGGACVLGAGFAGDAHGYDVVQRGGKVLTVTSLAFSGTNALLATDAGRSSIEASGIDFYETFRRNLGQAGGNLVVFKTGALLRFENLELKDGSVAVRVAGGSAFIVPESLVDFEASVREGAMLRLPASAMSSVAVSRSSHAPTIPGGFDEVAAAEEFSVAPPDPEAAPEVEPGPTGRPPRPGRPGFNRPRRFGADRGEMGVEATQEPQSLSPVDDGEALAPSDRGDSVPFGGGGGQRGGQQQGGQQSGGGGQPQEGTGQSVVMLTTTYSGEIGGLQVTVTFPPNLKVVQPVGFSGFASALAMPTVNANIPGQVQLIAVNADISGPGVQAGGEFLRLTFAWSGRAPTAQQFSAAVKATDPTTGAEIAEFPREISVF